MGSYGTVWYGVVFYGIVWDGIILCKSTCVLTSKWYSKTKEYGLPMLLVFVVTDNPEFRPTLKWLYTQCT